MRQQIQEILMKAKRREHVTMELYRLAWREQESQNEQMKVVESNVQEKIFIDMEELMS